MNITDDKDDGNGSGQGTQPKAVKITGKLARLEKDIANARAALLREVLNELKEARKNVKDLVADALRVEVRNVLALALGLRESFGRMTIDHSSQRPTILGDMIIRHAERVLKEKFLPTITDLDSLFPSKKELQNIKKAIVTDYKEAFNRMVQNVIQGNNRDAANTRAEQLVTEFMQGMAILPKEKEAK